MWIQLGVTPKSCAFAIVFQHLLAALLGYRDVSTIFAFLLEAIFRALLLPPSNICGRHCWKVFNAQRTALKLGSAKNT